MSSSSNRGVSPSSKKKRAWRNQRALDLGLETKLLDNYRQDSKFYNLSCIRFAWVVSVLCALCICVLKFNKASQSNVISLVTIRMSEQNVEQILMNGNDQFTAKMFNEVIKNKADKSCVLSAFSVLSPLAQLALASVGESHDEILKVIGMPNDDVTKEAFSQVNSRLRSVKGVELKQANKVYVRVGYSLNDEFAVISNEVFNSEVQNINFKSKHCAANEINAWVEHHTNKRIQNLVDPESLTEYTAAVLVNAIYFKGSWKLPFEKSATRKTYFHVTKGKKVAIPTMHQTDMFKYGESIELNAKLLEMFYEGDETSFVIVLPNQYEGIGDLTEKLKDPAAFSKGRADMYYSRVSVSMPKFKIETTTDLKDVLEKINIKKLFNEKTARLDNLIKGEKKLFISDAIQKAFIEVNEEGAEAAAANKFGVSFPTSVGGDYCLTFDADHPFAFFLMEKDNILFNGIFRS